MVENAILTAIRRYFKSLNTYGIRASQLVPFGSFARGNADEFSDIDLIVIAPELEGLRELTVVEKLWEATASADNRIEPIPCGEQEWQTDGSRPILEIARREGIAITV
jgi:predicted nucleotidyltransferase